jgi:hypothetical protein
MVSVDGEVIHFDLEAYVVRNMQVPLLLGEDFQSAYELGIKRSATGHCKVQVGQSRHIIPASSAHSIDLGFRIWQASMAKSMKRLLPGVWHKTYQHSKARKCREEKLEAPPVLATKDMLIAAGTVHNVPITGPFKGKEEWLVEKVVIATEDESVMATPSTLIHSDSPFLPIANPSTRPWYIRAGDIVRRLHYPAEYADTPKNEEQREKFVASVEALACAIQEMQHTQGPESLPREKHGMEDKLEEDEAWGPKTTALLGDFEGVKEGEDVAQLVNLGPDVPEHIHPQLDKVLCHNSAAFRVGRCLGHVKDKAPILLKPGTQSISIPMYAALPLKREVKYKQMDLWFERKVIEPSVSPWGALCVVVFRNRKLRLAVNYRKLNEKTIADEFLIPRQSDIIQALSGAQALSSFDVLAGFN